MPSREFYQVVEHLRRVAPCAYPVKVRTVAKLVDPQGRENDGDCLLVGRGARRHFRIRIRKQFTKTMVDTLVHEWGHALAWNHLHDTTDEPRFHEAEWGIAYAQCYRAVYEGFYAEAQT